MGSKTSIYLSTKAMAYKEIEPCARALGMQVLILDPKSYRWNDKLEQKFRTLGIADSEFRRIEYELEDQQAIVILKSKKYYGAPEIAPHFAKFDLDADSIHYMRSVNAEKHPTWGDLDATIPPEKRIFLYWIRLDVLDENNDPALEEDMRRSERSLAARMRPLVERWEPDFDDKPVNQWGERWQSLSRSNWLFNTIEEAAKDCQIDLFDDGPKLERLGIDSVHMMASGNLIVTIFGGANGGGMRGGCNLKHYLCLVRKLLEKLVGCLKPFQDSWLIDWDNDCADDVWTLRIVLEPNAETKQKIIEDGYEVLKIEESKDDLDPDVKFVRDFKNYFGYRDEYFPKHGIADVEMSIARECALRMPTDTAAREIEGDAVMLLVLSGDEESVKIGKKLGNCMMKNGKHDQETLLKLMSDAYKRLMHIDADEKVKEEISKKKEELMKMMKYPKEKVLEAIQHWKGELEKLDESFGGGGVDYKKLWSDFKAFYEKGEDNCDVSFRINGDVKGLLGFVNTSDTLGVKLKNLSQYTREEGMVLDVKSFIKEMLSCGLTTSKIKKIEANFEGKGYDLVGYTENTPRMRRVFFFEFGDGNDELNKFFTEDDKAEKPTKEVLDAKADDAKKEAAKVKDEAGAKKFLDDNKEKIEKLSSSLKGDAKKNFDEIVQFVKDNTEKVDEASKDSTKHTVLLKLLFGCVGVIAFMLSLNTFAWVALSPIVGPLLLGTVKKISGLKESCDEDDKSEEEKESK